MDWHTIQDMPLDHTHIVTTLDEIDEIIIYCINDVKSTKHIMSLCRSQIDLRSTLSGEYNIDLLSASEAKISKEIFGLLLSQKMKISKKELKQMRTYRKEIAVKDIILPYISFTTAPFQATLERFKKVLINPLETKNAFKYVTRYRGSQIEYGLGGIHGATETGIYESTDDMVIVSSDVSSYYPNLAIKNRWSPAHIPNHIFCDLYEWFYTERKKIPKKDPKNYVYKIVLNSTYGLSKEQHNFLYDPLLTMQIVINGQLSLTMLLEMICEKIPEAKPLIQNTDGLETLVPRNKLELYYKICKDWEQITQLQLEHDLYEKIMLRDVNNYIALTTTKEVDKETYDDIKSENPHYVFKEENNRYYYASTKCKGAFEFHDLALHKNKSYLIIRKAIYNYFIHGKDPETYIKSEQNIFDFCAGKKIKGSWEFVEHYVNDGAVKQHKLQKTIRYYISKKGSKVIKRNYIDTREQQLEAGKWLQKLFINYEKKNFEEYDIDYSYYMRVVRKEIENIEKRNKQLKLL